MLCFSNNSVLQPATGSGGRSGAAEKLVNEERLSSFHGSSLLIGRFSVTTSLGPEEVWDRNI